MITEDQLTYEDMVKTAEDGHVCGICGGRLSVCWGGAFGINGHILRCGNDINHNTINRHDKEHEKKISQIKEARNLDSKSLMVMNETAMMQRVSMSKFPKDLTVPEKKMLAQAAITYGFDPLMGEISIYQGQPYVSIDGRYRKAQETGRLDGVETRPATKEERDAWSIPDGDYFFRAEVHVKGASRPFVGWGRVRAKETTGGKGFKPVETNPQRMAEKRAEAQALRKAFHIPLPSAEDIDGVEVTPSGKVDTLTGEVIESTAEVVDDTPATSTPSTKRDPGTIKTTSQLQKALFEDFKLQPKEQLAELNLETWQDLAITPAEAYTQIAAIRQ